jgi:ABC-type multidrug transport system ATPase subunit
LIGLISAHGSNDMEVIRKTMGFCPQTNILWPDLTPLEHLIVFGGLRGHSVSASRLMALDSLQGLGLTEKAHSLVKTLSGGQLRRVCMAVLVIVKLKSSV